MRPSRVAAFAVALVIATPTFAAAVASPTPTWVSRFGSRCGFSEATAVAASPLGTEVFVIGEQQKRPPWGPTKAVLFAASSATGDRLWRVAVLTTTFAALTTSPDGSLVFVTGVTGHANRADYRTIAFSTADGSVVWDRRYDGPQHEEDGASAITTDGTRVFVTGSSTSNSDDYATVAYDASTGAFLWARRYDDPQGQSDGATAIATGGEDVFVTGVITGPNDAGDYATVSYNASSGHRRWVATFNDPYNGYDAASAITTTTDGSAVFVTGQAKRRQATIAYDGSTGAELWHDGLGGAGVAVPVPLTMAALAPDASALYAAGNGVVVAFDATTGGVDWRTAHRANGYATKGLTVAPDGSSVFIAGYTDQTFHLLVAARTADTGAVQWRSQLPQTSTGLAVAAAPDSGDVFVTGDATAWPTGCLLNDQHVHVITADFPG